MSEVTEPEHTSPATVETVEAVVRRQMAQSLGGRRGMVEAGVPGLVFTLLWLTTKDLPIALISAGGVAVAALVIRLLERTTVQYVVNAIVGIAIGWVFVRLAASSGGTESEQALAFFLPGIIWSGAYTVLMVFSCLVGWPFIGFMVGSVSGDPTAWHDDKQVVRLCSRLTWLFLAPGAIGVLLQGPVYLLGHSGTIDTDTAVAIIGVLRLGLGWPLRIASWGTMVWLLARNATPVQGRADAA
ncbi:DUF3159 domain-containing protein [Nocardioides sp. CER19]|uniref:DUF3159 domain-containing protein n=1 Tax=Nocardioides sp. CER19 TaxID=3038538 RepID=UPI002446A090|nr:DUF3159 domain-containing protein [Nocardioides sp. CER19]MDH2416567.1 DUF3159 domain-containing protein [Nocardioides sp. CER19]